jgi:hypothetical protein
MPIQMPKVQYDSIRLTGGLDLLTPTLSLPMGVARDAYNFEVSITGGYSRIAGYERFDGQANPSDASYSVLTAINFAGAFSVGDRFSGQTSGASAYVADVSYPDSSTVQIVYTRLSGTFVVGELLTLYGAALGGGEYTLASYTFKSSSFAAQSLAGGTGASVVPRATVATTSAASTITDAIAATYTAAAADVYRTAILAVPGSGSIRGVTYLNGVVYAFRDNAGGTAGAIYKSSSSGWVAVTLGKELAYNTGTAAIAVGNTVTGATSGATGVVAQVTLESGTYGSSNATGRLILSSTTGTFAAAENLTVASVVKAKAVGAATQISLLPGGRYEFGVSNFGGATGSTKIYGCDGVNRGFEFDGTTYTPIATGMAADTPNHVVVHKNRLFFSFNASLQFSGAALPFSWTPVLGAGELVVAEPITCLAPQPGNQGTGALAVYTRNNTYILYGSGSSDFNLVYFNTGTGGWPYTSQNLNQTYVFDDRGVVGMATTLNYGNFDSAALTQNIRPWVQARRNAVIASCLNREKSQYRVFFSDGYGLYLTISNGQMMGAMPVVYPNPVACITEGQTPNGAETSFFGSTNGFVYRLDAGTSFDGAAMSWSLTLPYNATNAPRVLKRYRRASLEVQGAGYAQFQFGYSLGYGTTDLDQQPTAYYATGLKASYWDTFTWDNFTWDGRTLVPSEVEMVGTAENLAISITGSSNSSPPFTINSVIFHYSTRRGLR